MKQFGMILGTAVVAACGTGELSVGERNGDVKPVGHTVEHGDPGAGDPAAPGDPTTPGDPTAPGDPATPGDPASPGDPATPGDPVTPGDPTPGDPIDPGAVEINPGWIGGACDTPADCWDSNIDNPICETDGFHNGFCTQACSQSSTTGSWICPDTNYTGTLATVSRCISASGEPMCASECDYTLSTTGCRPGYECVTRSRYGDSSSSFPICLPEGGWPAPLPIGGPCLEASDCTYGTCLLMQDGYCSRKDCNQTGCPTGSTCFRFGEPPDDEYYCLDDCGSHSDCRQADRYQCGEQDVCFQAPPPSWNANVGASDCSTSWGNLSNCDTTPDQYIVVRKSARNIALCSNGTLVANYHGALGFSPLGDKAQEGDGRTPEGTFYVARRINPSQYYRAFLLSYPDADDAARGLASGLITSSERNSIVAAQNSCSEPPQGTGLGGLIEIHGESQTGAVDWTFGCIATESSNVDALWATINTGDTIIVLP